jgi:hypothetical protein
MITWSIRKISQPLGTAGIPMNIEISFPKVRCKEYDVPSLNHSDTFAKQLPKTHRVV